MYAGLENFRNLSRKYSTLLIQQNTYFCMLRIPFSLVWQAAIIDMLLRASYPVFSCLTSYNKLVLLASLTHASTPFFSTGGVENHLGDDLHDRRGLLLRRDRAERARVRREPVVLGLYRRHGLGPHDGEVRCGTVWCGRFRFLCRAGRGNLSILVCWAVRSKCLGSYRCVVLTF